VTGQCPYRYNNLNQVRELVIVCTVIMNNTMDDDAQLNKKKQETCEICIQLFRSFLPLITYVLLLNLQTDASSFTLFQ
jgi:hypothetical protein